MNYLKRTEIDRAIKDELAGLSQTLTSVPGIGPVFAERRNFSFFQPTNLSELKKGEKLVANWLASFSYTNPNPIIW